MRFLKEEKYYAFGQNVLGRLFWMLPTSLNSWMVNYDLANRKTDEKRQNVSPAW